jgi:hypothetical protein
VVGRFVPPEPVLALDEDGAATALRAAEAAPDREEYGDAEQCERTRGVRMRPGPVFTGDGTHVGPASW